MNNKYEYDETIKNEFNALMHLGDSDYLMEYTDYLTQENKLLKEYLEIERKYKLFRNQIIELESSKEKLDRLIFEKRRMIVDEALNKILVKAKIVKIEDCFFEINKLISIIAKEQDKSELFEFWNNIERELLMFLILFIIREKIKNDKDYISIQDLREYSNDLYDILTKDKFDKNTTKDDWIDIGINIQYENLLNMTKNVNKILQTGIVCIQSRLTSI